MEPADKTAGRPWQLIRFDCPFAVPQWSRPVNGQGTGVEVGGVVNGIAPQWSRPRISRMTWKMLSDPLAFMVPQWSRSDNTAVSSPLSRPRRAAPGGRNGAAAKTPR